MSYLSFISQGHGGTEKSARLQKNPIYFMCLVVMVIIFLLGCQLGDDPDFDGIWLDKTWVDGSWLNGTWSTEYDSYSINTQNLILEYDDGGWGMGFTGNIVGIMLFNTSGTAGIVFIEYTAKPVDYSTEMEPDGDFIGIYFRNLSDTSGQFASPAEEYEKDKFRTPAKATLEEAKAAFTEDLLGDYISFWATYTKE